MILTHPDDRLRQLAVDVPADWEELADLVARMRQALERAGGIGLAAPQIGVGARVVIVDLTGRSAGKSEVFVNPIIDKARGETRMEEGCLSVPGKRVWVPRAKSIRVRATDLQGRPVSIKTSGLHAVCLQHEVDHLDGRLIVDHLPG